MENWMKSSSESRGKGEVDKKTPVVIINIYWTLIVPQALYNYHALFYYPD